MQHSPLAALAEPQAARAGAGNQFALPVVLNFHRFKPFLTSFRAKEDSMWRRTSDLDALERQGMVAG